MQPRASGAGFSQVGPIRRYSREVAVRNPEAVRNSWIMASLGGGASLADLDSAAGQAPQVTWAGSVVTRSLPCTSDNGRPQHGSRLSSGDGLRCVTWVALG